MSAAKRNEWLDGESEEDNNQSGYDSEAAEERKTIRPAKRRRLSTPNDDDGDLTSDDEAATRPPHPKRQTAHQQSDNVRDEDDSIEEAIGRGETDVSAEEPAPRRIRTPEIEPRQLSRSAKPTASKTGVVYLSRIPPFMKPQTLKHLLEPYGEVGRIFLTPEDPASHTKRVKSGGNKKRSFTDGWVEFQRKKIAKIVAETLNAQIIGGKKGGWYHDDVWNIKYLKGFKWHHLTEQIANENAERAARLRAEIAQTSKENKRFIANVERAKMLEGMAAKKEQRAAEQSSTDFASRPRAASQVSERKTKQMKSSFRQNEVKSKSGFGKGSDATVQRVLSKIF